MLRLCRRVFCVNTVSENYAGRLIDATRLLEAQQCEQALLILDQLKAHSSSLLKGVDELRARAFLMQGDLLQARQALLEEIRLFPTENTEARNNLHKIEIYLSRAFILPRALSEQEPLFSSLYDVLRPYTMLGWPRLFCLYNHARKISEERIEGSIVECGVAGGGSLTVMAVAAAYFENKTTKERAPSPGRMRRKYFGFDTFVGMPEPGKEDVLTDGKKGLSHWRTGTCAASAEHVEKLGRNFGLTFQTVKGKFEDTLETHKRVVGPIAVLHIDADWYHSTKTVLESFFDFVVPHGIVQIDDYHYWDGCRRAVDEFFKSRSLNLELHTCENNAVFFRKPS